MKRLHLKLHPHIYGGWLLVLRHAGCTGKQTLRALVAIVTFLDISDPKYGYASPQYPPPPSIVNLVVSA